MAGVLVAGSDDLGVGFGEGGAVTACPGLIPVGALVSSVNTCVGDTWFRCAWLLRGVCQSSRLLTEVELLEFLLRLA